MGSHSCCPSRQFYYTKGEIDKKLDDIVISGGGITSGDVEVMIDEAISGISIPTKVSAFENDVPYLTQHQSLDGYVTDEEMSAFTYDKKTIDRKVASGGTFDPTNYYTKSETYSKNEVDNLIPTVPTNVSAFANDAGYLTEHQDLSDYATKEYVSGYTYDKNEIDRKVASGGTFDPTAYYTKIEVNNLVESAKTDVEDEIPTVPTNVSAFANDAGYLTEHQSLSNYYTKSETSGKTEIDNALNLKADKSEIPTVPTNVSAFVNDVGYLTEHQSLSAYSTTDEVNSAITEAVSGKASQSDLESVSGNVKTLSSSAVTGVRMTTVSAQKQVNLEQAKLGGGYSSVGVIYVVGSGLTFDSTYKKIAVDSSVIAQKSDLSNYSTTDEVNSAITEATSGLQETLVAGSGITIEGNVISSTASGGATYTAGRGIDITSDVISFNLPISGGTGVNSVIENDSGNVASSLCTHAEGSGTTASEICAHAEGHNTNASGQYSHAEGDYTKAKGLYSHAEGNNTTASGLCAHAEGSLTRASGTYAHAEGNITKANGESSHAEGYNTNASGKYSHAEGNSTTASSDSSHAEGQNTIASGNTAHAEGNHTTAGGNAAHAEGIYTKANGYSSHAEGYFTIAQNQYEHACGALNISSKASETFGDSGNTLFSIGNSTNASSRHNAFEVRQNGDIYITCNGTDVRLQDYICSLPTFSCISERQWQSISGNPDSNTIYLVHE